MSTTSSPEDVCSNGRTETEEYREVARSKLLPKGYSGYMHLASLFAIATPICATCLYTLEPMTWFDLASIPTLLVILNIYEYVFHRFPSHRLLLSHLSAFRLFFKSHTGLHHKFFTFSSMQPNNGHLDSFFILFPVKVYGSFLLPWNTAVLCTGLSSAYLVFYELVHCYSHRSLPTPVLAVLQYVPWFNFFRRHHQLHHHPRVMNTSNYNLTFPFSDWLAGTLVTRLPD
ncbi:uncharacterized protein LOC135809724 isoform X2 [Sycon ciliatum]|uniref:uncharacterized protein LOC135809724 isoform X2 n=1 Tax=Sycon ciliatum TaxID=27933 RepID=UPI0031F6ADBA